jgi:hypothetical protein
MVNIRTISRVSKFIREQFVHALFKMHLELSYAQFKHMFIEYISLLIRCSRVAIALSSIVHKYILVESK